MRQRKRMFWPWNSVTRVSGQSTALYSRMKSRHSLIGLLGSKRFLAILKRKQAIRFDQPHDDFTETTKLQDYQKEAAGLQSRELWQSWRRQYNFRYLFVPRITASSKIRWLERYDKRRMGLLVHFWTEWKKFSTGIGECIQVIILVTFWLRNEQKPNGMHEVTYALHWIALITLAKNRYG